MSRDGYLPPGVEHWDIPGNGPEESPDFITCIGCGLEFDCSDEIQSIFHERYCVEIMNDYDQVTSHDVGKRLYRKEGEE